MRWNRIVWKLGGTIVLLFLIVLLPMGFVIDRIFTGYLYSNVQKNIEQLSSQYAKAMTDLQKMNNPAMITMIAEFSNVTLFIVNENGEIVSQAGLPEVEGKTISGGDLLLLKKGQAVLDNYTSLNSKRKYLQSGSPVIRDQSFTGGVFVLSSLDETNRSVQMIRRLLLLSGIGALFLAVGFTYVLSKKLSNPLIQMEEATRKIAKGHLDVRVNIISSDEIGSLAQAVNDLAADLQRYRDTRREFLANISHDLRTPITYINGYAKVLSEDLIASDEERKQYLFVIHQEANRMTRLVDDLFETAKIDEGKISLYLEWVDLAELLRSLVQKVDLIAKEKGLLVKMDIPNDVPFLYCDGLRMEQVISNLIDNALQYTNKGWIAVQLLSTESEVKIRIQDTGIGIPTEDLPYIFERFYRVNNAKSISFGGSGLGLAIVKRLVELQDGDIHVLSTQGQGTTIELSFPISREA